MSRYILRMTSRVTATLLMLWGIIGKLFEGSRTHKWKLLGWLQLQCYMPVLTYCCLGLVLFLKWNNSLCLYFILVPGAESVVRPAVVLIWSSNSKLVLRLPSVM